MTVRPDAAWLVCRGGGSHVRGPLSVADAEAQLEASADAERSGDLADAVAQEAPSPLGPSPPHPDTTLVESSGPRFTARGPEQECVS